MNKKFIQSFLFLLILSACSSNQTKTLPVSETPQNISQACEITKTEKIIEGNSMSPMLSNGDKINLLENYYKCGHKVEIGDLVAYNYGGDIRPLIKVARVGSEEEVEIIGNKIQVNGAFLKNSVDQEYSFSPAEINMLNLYIHDKHIPQNTFFIFGDNPTVSTDSRKFGAVSPDDFLGKFEK